MDATQANLEAGLAQFLGHDRGRGVRIQEAVAQDLPHGLVGTAVIGFGAGLLRLQRQQAAGLVGLQELVVALAAKAVLLGDVNDVILQTLPFNEHEEAVSQLIADRDAECAGGADQLVRFGIELQGCIHQGSIEGEGISV